MPGLPALRPQVAGRAITASIAPVVQHIAGAAVAGMRARPDQFHEFGSAQFTGEFPCLGLVALHQRRLDDQAFVQAQGQRFLGCVQRIATTVRVARKSVSHIPPTRIE